MERTVISKSVNRVNRPKGSSHFIYTEQVVYKNKLADGRYTSTTKHEHDTSRK